MRTKERNPSLNSLLDVPPPPIPEQSLNDRRTNNTTTRSSFDYCSGAYRRSMQRNLGQQIARRRFLKRNSPSIHESSSNNNNNNNNNLVFRRNVTVQDDWDTHEPYHQIEFLNQHDVVLAADKFGKVDVVRLPRYHPHGTCENDHDDNDNNNDYRKDKPLGTLLAGKVELESNFISPIVDPIEGGHVKLKGIRNGDAFVVGTPSGDYHIFATEHASTWGRNTSGTKQPFDTTTSAIPIRQERLSTTTSTNRLGSSSRSSSSTTGTKHMHKPFVQTHGWNIPRPSRRFHRDRQDSKYSLQHMMRNPIEALSLCHSMTEINGWSIGNGIGDSDHNFSNTGDLWDFRETSSSSLLAAHVDYSRDCFSLSIMDNRVVPHTPSNNHHNTKKITTFNHPPQQQHKKKQTVVCIDMTSQDNGSDKIYENISALCFVSEHCLATAHNICQESMREFDIHVAPLQSTVKLWDLRMPTKALELPIFSSPASGGGGGGRIPQFPYDHVYSYDEPVSVFDMSNTQQYQEGSPPLSNPATHNKSFLTGLCGSKEGEGTILLSSLTPQEQVIHSLLDPSRMEILPQHIRVRARHQTAHYFSLCSFNTSNRVSTTPDHEFVASFTQKPSGDGEIIQLYDWSRPNRARNHVEREQQQKNNNTPYSTNRKRSYQGEILADNNSNHEQSEPYQCGTIETKLLDRHGTRSSLTCIALNDCGSALVCGSNDGDLYLWQGG